MRKRLLQAALAVSLAAAVGGAASAPAAPGPETATTSTAVTTTLNVRLSNDYPSLDPMVDTLSSFAWSSITPAYDRFVTVQKDGTGFGPWLARSWTQTAKRITFVLRKDATCTDGHRLTAVDMLNSIKRFIFVQKRGGSPANTSAGGWGPGPYHLRANNKAGTLSLAVEKPWGPLLGLFAGLPVICPAGIKALESNPRALENATYGSGPYALVRATHAREVVYRLRKGWTWGPPGTSTRTMPENLVYKIVTDNTTAANLLLTGDLDVAQVGGPDVQRLLQSGSLGSTTAANWLVASLSFNMRPGRPFAAGTGDVLRRAIFTALDPKLFNQVVYAGRGHISPSIFRRNMTCFDKSTTSLRPTPSIDRARQLLTQGGYTIRDGRLSRGATAVPTLDFVSSSVWFPNGGAYVMSVLRQLGFSVELKDLTSTYGSTVISGNFDMELHYANRPGPEPGTQINNYFGTPSPAGSNIAGTGFGDELWTRWYNAGLQNVGAGSCRYFALVQKMALQKHYVVPLVSPNYDVFYRKTTIGSMPKWPPDVYAFPWHYLTVK